MANGFWNFLKNLHKRKQETKDENNENFINDNPTEEQLKDNKNGNIAIVLSIISCFLLVAIIALIVSIFANYIWIGIISIVLLFIPVRLQALAVKKAKRQLNINGNGKIKFILVKFVFPITCLSGFNGFRRRI